MANLHTLEDDALIESLRRLETHHRETMASIIEHLVELERRRLALSLGYPSLYQYCVAALGLSEDEAYRRIAVARMAARVPAILDGLADGSLHLSGLVALAPHFRGASAETATELVDLARHQSRREIERRLAARFPQVDAPELVRRERGQIDPLSPGRYRVQLTIDQTTRDKLERALELMSHQNPEHALGPVLDRALDALLEKLERTQRAKLVGRTRARKPAGEVAGAVAAKAGAAKAGAAAGTAAGAAQRARREKPNGQQPTPAMPIDERQMDLWDFAATRSASATPAPARLTLVGRETKPRTAPTSPTRHLPRPLRRATFEGAGSGDDESCCFVGADGRRCGSRHFLEIDHVSPWAFEWRHRGANLRVLCRAHNQLEAERWFGRRDAKS